MKKINLKISTLSVLSLLSTFVVNAQTTLIHAGKVLVGTEQSVKEQQTLVIEGNKIAAIKAGFLTKQQLNLSDADVFDLKNQMVLPGLIDMHVHVTFERDVKRNPHQWVTEYEADYALRSLKFLKHTVNAGFTSVRDLGSSYQVIFPLKRAVERGDIVGPRIFAAGDMITPTGGHADMHGYRRDITKATEGGGLGVCDGADDCTRAVRDVIKSGADVIKITATGGVLSNTAAGVNQQFTDEELSAIVNTAHHLGRKVTAHAHGTEGIKAALRAGVDSIEHGSFLDKDTVKLFKKQDAYLVPTLLAGATVKEEVLNNPNMPKAIAEKVEFVAPKMEESFKLALKNNVKIAFGTDSGVSKHGDNAKEFELLVNYGMTPKQAIKSATVEAAKLLGQSDNLGDLSVGKQADIISVNMNVLDNISELSQVQFVMKGGKVLKQ
nr:amidohydrolase family protein [Pseudoalteromonas sp. bablab_jr010]